MIEAYLGLPGQGKTYLMSQRGLAFMRRGKKVYANYPLRGSERYNDISEVLGVKDAVILIDEAGLVVPASMWRSLPHDVLSSWRQHRHDGVDILYTAQDWDDVGTALRRVTQFAWEISRIWRLGFYQVVNPRRRKNTYDKGFFILRKSIFDAYDTHYKVGEQEYQRAARERAEEKKLTPPA